MRDTKRMRDEDTIRTKQTPHMKPQTLKQRRTATETALERSVRKLLRWGREGVWGGVLNQFYWRETSPLFLMQLQITNICSVRTLYRGSLPHL